MPSAADIRINQAEEHYLAGKRLYQQGNLDGARVEFDKAIDILIAAAGRTTDRAQVDRKMDELIAAIYRYDVDGLGSGERQREPQFDRAPLEDILELTFPVNPNLKPRVMEEVVATSSQLPLQVNDSVLGFINYFSSDRGHRSLVASLKRSGRYRAMILRILQEENVPQELLYLAQAESGFLPRAVSQAAASGMWQFVADRGRQYGLRQTPFTDDRYDPEKATRAAARHLRDLYHQFGDWHLAIAAYNCGPGCVDRAVQRTGYADYWQLRARGAVPKETTNYVPIILALTIMAKNPQDYGLEGLEFDAPLEYDTVAMTANTNLTLIADLAERPLGELHELNPALLGNTVPAGYEVHVPKNTGETVMAGLSAIPENRRLSVHAHRIGRGENLAAIARQFNTSTASLLEANSKTEESAATGDVLIIPTRVSEVDADSASPVVHGRRGHRGRAAATTHAKSSGRAPAPSSRSRRAASSSHVSSAHASAPVRPAVLKTAAPRHHGRGATYTTASLRRGR